MRTLPHTGRNGGGRRKQGSSRKKLVWVCGKCEQTHWQDDLTRCRNRKCRAKRPTTEEQTATRSPTKKEPVTRASGHRLTEASSDRAATRL